MESAHRIKGLVRSDHLAVMVTPRIQAKPERKHVYFRDVRQHRKIDMENKLKFFDWSRVFSVNDVEEAVLLLNQEISLMFNESFPQIKVKTSSRHPPYMSPLVKYLCNIRNKQINRGANTDLQERINKLIRENQIRGVRNEDRKYQIGAKGWWNTANRITGRTSKSDNISATIDPSVINTYFQNVNTDSHYIPPRLFTIPQETRIPKIDIQTVKSFMMKQKRTSPGPDGLPYWLWKEYANYLAPVLTYLTLSDNLSLHDQCVPSLWKLANISINWIISFLTNRKQGVVVDGFITEYANINRELSQGTVIGPFLFSLMVEDIKPKQPEINKLIKFADDMTVSAPVRSNEDSSMEEVKHIENWAVRKTWGRCF